jgi:hypothetical protein
MVPFSDKAEPLEKSLPIAIALTVGTMPDVSPAERTLFDAIIKSSILYAAALDT